MTGIILDGVLMILLVVAIGYGVRLEKKLKILREGQTAFAAAVSELNTAASRAEAALASLRASGQETDLLHDRIVKARAVKQELETLIARAPVVERARADAPLAARPAERAPERPVVAAETIPEPVRMETAAEEEARERRMAALLNRIHDAARAAGVKPQAAERVSPVMQALAANQAAQQSLNRARRSLDGDLFAA